jgi:uncharacterized membrane protein YfcA
MAIAAICGGYAGARLARKLPTTDVRIAITVIAFGLALWFFIQPIGGAP